MSANNTPARVAAADMRLRLKCLVAVLIVRIALLVAPFSMVRAALRSRVAGQASPHYARQVARRVAAAARWVPGATCLTQALAARWLLARSGHPTSIRIGVGNDPAGRFAAHAWLLCADTVLLGGRPDGSLTPIADFG